MRISITGTPGTGKTEVAAKLGRALGLPVFDLNAVLTKDYALRRDEERDTLVVDVQRAAAEVELPRDCIIDGHLSHFLPVNVVVVLRCRPKELYQRLVKKGWAAEKVEENVEAEALNIIAYEARELNKLVQDVDTTGKTPAEVAAEIRAILDSKSSGEPLDFLEFL